MENRIDYANKDDVLQIKSQIGSLRKSITSEFSLIAKTLSKSDTRIDIIMVKLESLRTKFEDLDLRLDTIESKIDSIDEEICER